LYIRVTGAHTHPTAVSASPIAESIGTAVMYPKAFSASHRISPQISLYPSDTTRDDAFASSVIVLVEDATGAGV